MKVMVIYGNPKEGGFVHGSLDIVRARLEDRGVEIDELRLAREDIKDCTGCFRCLATGKCVIDDAMNDVCERIRQTEGIVAGASVRNGNVPALYKRFYERITYPILFTGDMTEKYVVGISAVGFATGKKATRRMVAMTEGGARTVAHLFFRTGIPTQITTEDVKDRLERAADKLYEHIKAQRPGPFVSNIVRAIDRWFMVRCMFLKAPETYKHVLESYKKRGWMKG